LQLAQADAERGALSQERLTKIRDSVSEFANNLSEQEDRVPPKVSATTDVEATSAVETVAPDAPYENLPILAKEDLPAVWQGEHPVLCVAGRSSIDEAAAIMLGQLSTAHGLSARVEPAEVLATTNIFRLETAGVEIVCLVYLDANAPAHMRYSVRRLRRKLPKARVVLVCPMSGADRATMQQLGDGAKADLVAASLGEAVQLCIEATGLELTSVSVVKDDPLPVTTAA
jgi:hypothetical protein